MGIRVMPSGHYGLSDTQKAEAAAYDKRKRMEFKKKEQDMFDAISQWGIFKTQQAPSKRCRCGRWVQPNRLGHADCTQCSWTIL